MKKNILLTIVFQLIILIMISCSSTSTKEKINHSDLIISNDGVAGFKLNSSILNYDLSKYKAVVDTSASLSEDEVEETKGKIIYFNNDQYLVLWLDSNKIIEIDINSDGFITKDSLKVGMNFEELFNKIHRDYKFDDEFNFSFYLPQRNILFIISNSNSELFSVNEINDLYKHKLSIKSNQLKKMKVESILIKKNSFVD